MLTEYVQYAYPRHTTKCLNLMISLSSIDPKERTSYTDIDNRFSGTVSSGTFPDIPETHSFMNRDLTYSMLYKA